jgi:hypothetical protein
VAVLLVAPSEGAEKVVASLAELGEALEIVRADPVAGGDGPAALAAALAAYEAQARDIAPIAAIVHGSGDRTLAATISLAKLEIPVARVAAAEDDDLAGLVADRVLAHDEAIVEEVREWLRGLFPAGSDASGPAR